MASSSKERTPSTPIDKNSHQEFDCSICLNLANDAVETLCCHAVFCEHCVKGLLSWPVCPEVGDVRYTINVPVRRFIEKVPVQCTNEGCGAKVPRSELEKHVKAACEFRQYSVNLLNSVEKQFAMINCQMFDGSLPLDERIADVVVKRVNRAGNVSTMGITGKFYCGQAFSDRENCGGFGINYPHCCSVCGPSFGCNCVDCMRLDIETSGLERGRLVNIDGRTTDRPFFVVHMVPVVQGKPTYARWKRTDMRPVTCSSSRLGTAEYMQA